ncbi:MAG: alanine:cation symporter family protein [Myxococcota bacterium]
MSQLEQLATSAWTPWIAGLVLGGGVILLLGTVGSPLRGLPRAIAALRRGAVTEGGHGPLWLPLAAATGMGGITGGVLAVSTGGPGALVWMWVTTVLGMAIVFAEGSLAARAPTNDEPATIHLLAAPGLGRLLAPMYALAVVVMALVVGAAFQTHQAAAVFESTLGIPPRSVAIALAVIAAPFVLLPRIRRPLLMLVPGALVLYAGLALTVLSKDDLMLSLQLGDAVNEAFGITPAAGGAAGGGVGLMVTHGVLRATLAGEAGLGSAALLDLRGRSRGTAGAVVMLVPLLAAGVVGSLSAMLMLGGPGRDAPVADPELVPLERTFAQGLRPSQQVGQTVVLPQDTTMEAGKFYGMKLRANPRGHVMAKLVKEKNHVALPHWAVAQVSDTVVFRPRDEQRAKNAAWDIRIPCDRELRTSQGGLEYVLLRPKDPEIDLYKLTAQLGLSAQPYVNFDDFSFPGRVGRATSPDASLGEHLAMFEPPHEDRPFNPKLHEFFRNGYRGPYADDDGPRPPWAFVAREGFDAEVGSLVDLRIVGDPRGNDVLAITRSGSVEAPPWDLLLGATTMVIRHDQDPAQDIRLAVTPRYDLYRVRFTIANKRFEDMRTVEKMEGYSGPYLVVPDYEFTAEVHGDTRLPQTLAGRRTLVPVHPLGEVQGPFGDEPTYRPHPAELLAFGLTGPVPAYDGAQRVAARVTQGLGSTGRSLLAIVVFVFALSTIVGWSELGGRAATALAGSPGGPAHGIAMLIAAGVGTTWSLAELLPVVDLALAAVVVPSIVGLVLLLPKVKDAAAMKDDLGSTPPNDTPHDP